MAEELKKEDLEKVYGGTLTQEAAAWLNQYESQAIDTIAKEKGKEWGKTAQQALTTLKGLPFEVGLDTVQATLSDYDIDVNQFN